MTDNIILENLQNGVVQELPIKSIYAQNVYSVFDKGTSEFYGEADEYVSTQPLEGIIWNKDLTGNDLKKLPPVFSCKLNVSKDIVVYTVMNKKKMKQALQSPAHLAALVDQLVDDLKTQAQLEINAEVDQVIATQDNYNAKAWMEITEAEATIDSQEKAIAALKRIKKTYNGMDVVSTDYNKGYQKPGTTPWNAVKANCETPQAKILVIDPDYLDDIELYFLSDVARDSNLNPNHLFKAVIKRKLPNNLLWSMHDVKNVVYRLINDEGIREEETLAGGMKKFAWEVELKAGMITFTNAAALAIK